MSAQVYDFATLAPQIEAALRQQFPLDTVELTPGYKGRTHVLVVSSQLNGMSERQKHDLIREVLKAELGEEAEAVSMVVGYGTDELR